MKLTLAAIHRTKELLQRVMLNQAIISSALKVPELSDVLRKEILGLHLSGRTGAKDLLSEFAVMKPYDPEHDWPEIAKVLADQAALKC